MERKDNVNPNTIENVKAGHYDTRGFGPRDFPTYNGVEITQEEIDNEYWTDVELITEHGDNIGRLYLNGQKIDADRKLINKPLEGGNKKRYRKRGGKSTKRVYGGKIHQ